jgi:competence protein ComEC
MVACLSFLVLAGDGAYWWRERWFRRDLRITFLSVGHGDAAVVEFPGSKVLLIDAGGSGNPRYDTGKAIIAPFLRLRRISKVDYVLVSHPRMDHYGGMKSVIEGFAPSEFWAGPFGARTPRFFDLEKTVGELGIKRVDSSRGDPQGSDSGDSCRRVGKVRLCFLYPPQGSRREGSVVLRLSFGRYHFLFPGDINKRDEELLVQLGAELPSHVLKVPRHGSQSSSTDAFVQAVSPRLAIFSVGHGNRFGLPRAEIVSRYLAAGADILRTDQDGAIIVETDGVELHYRTRRSAKKREFRF